MRRYIYFVWFSFNIKVNNDFFFRYTPVADLDYGTLSCSASNEIGAQLAPCVFQMVAAGGTLRTYSDTIDHWFLVCILLVLLFCRQAPRAPELYAVEPDCGVGGGVLRGRIRRRPSAAVPAARLHRGWQHAEVRTTLLVKSFSSFLI